MTFWIITRQFKLKKQNKQINKQNRNKFPNFNRFMWEKKLFNQMEKEKIKQTNNKRRKKD